MHLCLFKWNRDFSFYAKFIQFQNSVNKLNQFDVKIDSFCHNEIEYSKKNIFFLTGCKHSSHRSRADRPRPKGP